LVSASFGYISQTFVLTVSELHPYYKKTLRTIDPKSDVSARRRPLTAKDDLARILTWQETRTISKNLMIQFEKVVYQI
jgi:hypothetical protein